MTIRNLDSLFRPASVAVVSGPEGAGRRAEIALRNLGAGGFAGPQFDITAQNRSLLGIGVHAHLGKLDTVPELALICATAADTPALIGQLGQRGTRAAVLMSPWPEPADSHGRRLRQDVQEAARPHLLRLLGPASSGLALPALGLNASLGHVAVSRGRIALVAESAAVIAAVLDQAEARHIGFSCVLHLGESLDIDLADILDWLAADADTDAILLQFETVAGGRKFMSAARGAARNKPLVAIRCGHEADSGGQPFRSDEVYDAAIRRAGGVRIMTLEGLFDAAEAMARLRLPLGEQLAILANGRGLGHLAADALRRGGGQLANLAPTTHKRLHSLLGKQGHAENPVVLAADASADDWAEGLQALLDDPASGAVLTVNAPSSFAPSVDIAQAVCGVANTSARNVLSCWVGGQGALAARQLAASAGVLSYEVPEDAIAVYLGVLNYQRNRQLLLETPASLADDFTPDQTLARSAIATTLKLGHACLAPGATRDLLQAYGIAMPAQPPLRTIDAAVAAAEAIGYPVDLGLVRAMSDASAPGPVAHNLRCAADLRIAARSLRSEERLLGKPLRTAGYRLLPSIGRGDIALHLGVGEDADFGPLLYLGDHADEPLAVALPPLNFALALDLVQRAGVGRNLPAASRSAVEAAVCQTLMRLSQLLIDIDEVAAVQLDPVLVSAEGALVRSARIEVAQSERHHGVRRFAIRPYPRELEQRLCWNDGELLIRPIRPEDDGLLTELIDALDPADRRLRFFHAMRELPRSQLARMTQIDYDREMALLAIGRDAAGREYALGEARMIADPDNNAADFAVIVRSELKGRGLGKLLLQHLIDYSGQRGTGELRGETLPENTAMQRLAQRLGFGLKSALDKGTVELRLGLRKQG